jgi:GH43 family beta-xylosidase
MSKNHVLIVCLLMVVSIFPVNAMDCAFLNPIVMRGADPSVVYHDGYYYFVQSHNLPDGSSVRVAKSDTITGLGRAEFVTVYEPSLSVEYRYDIWAPELVYLNDSWYLYFAATNAPGNNPSHRTFVLQADTNDPLGSWTLRGQVYDPTADNWMIDSIPFEYNGQLYIVWSGWPTERGDFPQNLYIAEMSDPLTISSPRSLISEPDQEWEHVEAAINEGPQVFMHNGQLSIIYSADASWTPLYKLAMLVLTGDDPLDRDSWTKIGPIFEMNEDATPPIYGPGHASNPVSSPDGRESWFFYHTITDPSIGWDSRDIRVQRFEWSEDNTPQLGDPLPLSSAQSVPSGEPCGLIAEIDDVDLPSAAPGGALSTPTAASFVDLGEALVNTMASFTITAEVQLTQVNEQAAFISQEGGISSNFVLGYADRAFTFSMFDGLGQNRAVVESNFRPNVGVWYQVTGVYDVLNQQLSLYVDGELQGRASFTHPWDARGHTIIGAALRARNRVDLFTGEIRNAQLFNGALSEVEVQELAAE